MGEATHSERSTEITESDRSLCVHGDCECKSRCLDCQCASTQRQGQSTSIDSPLVKFTVRQPGCPGRGAEGVGVTPDPRGAGCLDAGDLLGEFCAVFKLNLIKSPHSLISARRTGTYDGGSEPSAPDPATLPPGSPFFLPDLA